MAGQTVCVLRVSPKMVFSHFLCAPRISFMFLSRPNLVEDAVLFANKHFEQTLHCHHISSTILFLFSCGRFGSRFIFLYHRRYHHRKKSLIKRFPFAVLSCGSSSHFVHRRKEDKTMSALSQSICVYIT